MTTPIPTFDLTGALPDGRLAIEASAGTGKTYTLSTLAARYVAEGGIPISQLLIVTFTRAAAAELKGRVRARLVEFHIALSSNEPPSGDEHLEQVWQVDRDIRRDRLQAAISDFDSATITTIHGFAQLVLGSLGSAVATDPDAVLVNDSRALTNQVATDLLVAEAVKALHPSPEVPELETLRHAAELALNNPDATLVPHSDLRPAPEPPVLGAATHENEAELAERSALQEQAASDRSAIRLRALVDAVIAEVTERRRRTGTMSFDDLLCQLRDTVVDPMTGQAARDALQDRYQVALIDEFQDTDPAQWAIFDAVFGHGATESESESTDTTLVLVGDPKQAIYAFRGANVHTYLLATQSEHTHRSSLDRNWRSDPAMLTANDALLSDVTFGHSDIRFQPVRVAPQNSNRVFATDDGDPLPALSLRLATGADVPRSKHRQQFVTVAGAESVIFAELATHVRDLLECAQIPDERDDNERTRGLRPDDVAVLIAANRQGPAARDALRALDIPAVIARGDNVLQSEAATHWHRLLHAVARPADARRARAAAASWFFGWDAVALADDDERVLGEVQEQLRRWGEHLSQHGVAAFVSRVWANTSVTARVLSLADGDRSMTDLDHISELLIATGATGIGPISLLSTFEELAADSGQSDPETDLAARRVETESRSVQIMTTFVAKGLEFPVVCCPFLWNAQGAKARDNIWWDAKTARRTIDVASDLHWESEGAQAERSRRADDEAIGSSLRVLYVALTRARHHTAVWWAPTDTAWNTALARVLFARRHESNVGSLDADQNKAVGDIEPLLFAAERVEPLDTEQSLSRLAPVVTRADGALEVVVVGEDGDDRDKRRWSGAESPSADKLAVATLDHEPDRERSRWSFTAITSRSRGERSHLDPYDDAVGDSGDGDEGSTESTAASAPWTATTKPADAGTEARDGAAPGATSLPLGDIAGGAGFGTLVHEVLEQVDFQADDLEDELASWVEDRLAWNPWPVDRDRLVEGLAATIRTPLGPLFAGKPLADLRRADRMDELSFDLTLGESGPRPTDGDIGRLLVEHLRSDDPVAPWARALVTGPFSSTLGGHLTGSIDLVARIHGDDGTQRFVVADYKTNRLAPAGTTPTAADFVPHRLTDAMSEHHYPLQAILYGVALHRYLRWRLADYDPAIHLGGVGYLFVRGMVGPETPTHEGVPNGLFDWRPPPEFTVALSKLLDGTPSEAADRGAER